MTNQTTTPSSSATGNYVLVYVLVTARKDFRDLHDNDRDALGSFSTFVPKYLPPDIAAAAALGAFHGNVPIKNPDCLEFRVCDEFGDEMHPAEGLNWYDMAEKHRAFLLA